MQLHRWVKMRLGPCHLARAAAEMFRARMEAPINYTDAMRKTLAPTTSLLKVGPRVMARPYEDGTPMVLHAANALVEAADLAAHIPLDSPPSACVSNYRCPWRLGLSLWAAASAEDTECGSAAFHR